MFIFVNKNVCLSRLRIILNEILLPCSAVVGSQWLSVSYVPVIGTTVAVDWS